MIKRFFKRKSQYVIQLRQLLGFNPNQVELYRQAFTHKSILSNNKTKVPESNERLEFLGDAVLDLIISHYLFVTFPFKDEGFLTQLRSRLVSRKMLNHLGVKIGLQELISANFEKEPKSIYGNALEALIGAIYLDKGYKIAEQFVVEKLLKYHVDIDEVLSNETDFKSRVIEFCQKEKKALAFTITEKEEGHQKIYTATLKINGVYKSEGTAYAKKQAEQLAAESFYKEVIQQ